MMRTFEEPILRDLWCQVLGLDDFDKTVSFGALGGTSIAAEQLAARIADSLGISIAGLDILSAECYATFVGWLRDRANAEKP